MESLNESAIFSSQQSDREYIRQVTNKILLRLKQRLDVCKKIKELQESVSNHGYSTSAVQINFKNDTLAIVPLEISHQVVLLLKEIPEYTNHLSVISQEEKTRIVSLNDRMITSIIELLQHWTE